MNYADLLPRLPHRLTAKFVIDESGCWLWTAAKQQGGYGMVKWFGESLPAHRLLYRLMVGPIPDGCDVDHICGVHACVNPEHLRPLEVALNRAQGKGKRLSA